jgi:hypothetical protein
VIVRGNVIINLLKLPEKQGYISKIKATPLQALRVPGG